MRCKVGDLAIIVRADRGQQFMLGLLVEVLRADMPGAWHVKLQREVTNPYNGFVSQFAHARDDYLRPIRDNPGDDETLVWAPLKETESV